MKNNSQQCCPDLPDTTWTLGALAEFETNDSSCTIQTILCVDVDGDHMDEIFVSVAGSGLTIR